MARNGMDDFCTSHFRTSISMFSQGFGLCVIRPSLFETYTAEKRYMDTRKSQFLSIAAVHLRRKTLKAAPQSKRLKVRIPNG
jgi:uncharacterized membrane protein YidH (DUF202 family)